MPKVEEGLGMTEVTIDMLRDFQACTLYYDFKYNKNKRVRQTQKYKTQGQFKDTLISIVNFFFFKKLSHQEPSYRALEHKWEKKWARDLDAESVLTQTSSATNAYPTDVFYTSMATRALREFHKWFASRPDLEVVLIDEPFTVGLSRTIALNGKFDLVLRNKKADGTYKYHIYTWSVNMGNKSADFWSAHFTGLDYAFRYRNDFAPMDVAYYLWDFTNPKPGVKSFLIEIKDHAVLKRWARDFSLKREIYPIRGLSNYCSKCPYDKPCANWQPEIAKIPEPKSTTKKRVVTP